jgi:hypothetical protein
MDDSRLLPRLRHTRWIGWTEVAGRDLLERPLAGLPRVGLGEDLPDRFQFATAETLTARGWSELEPIALANLRRRPAAWTVTHTRGGLFGLGKKPARLELIDEHACERLLDEEFLTKAHRLIDQEILAVAAPARGLLFAAPGIARSDEMAAFLALAERTFTKVPAHLEPISPAVFTVQEGRISGVILGHPRRQHELAPARGFPWPTRDAAASMI